MVESQVPRLTDEKGVELGQSALEKLRHAYGYVDGRARRSERNMFCAGVGSDDWELLSVCVGLGLARRGCAINGGEDVYFHVTPAGERFLRAHNVAFRADRRAKAAEKKRIRAEERAVKAAVRTAAAAERMRLRGEEQVGQVANG